MKNSIKTITAFLATVLISCGSQSSEGYANSNNQLGESKMESYEETSEMTAASAAEEEYSKTESFLSEDHKEAIASVAATMVNDSNMRFIRKANLKFKTGSVRNTTYYLENAVVGLGGIVTYTSLYSDVQGVKKIAISKDSSLKITTYQMNNYMTIRIPNKQLDSLLKVISKSVVFLDNRNITADEISLVELKNQLEQKRLANYQNQLAAAIKNKSDKMNKVVDAHENMLYKQKLEDEAMIRNLELDYEVDYSTVELNIYQDTSLDKEMIENELNLEEFEPSFGTKMKDSLMNGWNGILMVLVELANLWFLFLLIILGIVVYKRWRKRNQVK